VLVGAGSPPNDPGENRRSRATRVVTWHRYSQAMTVPSRGPRVRRGGRRPGWVLFTALLVLAIGASSALVFTNRVELLKLAVILALWAAVAGAFVSVLYRRQSDADQSRVRDLKLVYDLQLDREISARREYELTVESQLRRELASELRAQAADDVAALRAELAALRTHLEILFDTDLEHRPALGAMDSELSRPTRGRAYSDWERNGESGPVDWVNSDRITSVRRDHSPGSPGPSGRADEASIIDVPEEPLLPPRPSRQRERARYEAPFEAPFVAPEPFVAPAAERFMAPGPDPFAGPPPVPQMPSSQVADRFVPPPMPETPLPPVPEPRFEPRHRSQPAPEPATPPQREPQPQDWQPVPADGHWLPPGTPGTHWSGLEAADSADPSSGRRRRARHYVSAEGASESDYEPGDQPPAPYDEPGRRSRSRHSAEYRDYSVSNLISRGEPQPAPPPAAAPAPPPPPPAPPPAPHPAGAAAGHPPKLAPPLPPEPASRHRGAESPDHSDAHSADTGGQSVAELLARFHVQPTGGGRRRRRDG
jgi:hypothetical protein